MILIEQQQEFTDTHYARVPLGRIDNAIVLLWMLYNYDTTYPSIPSFRYGGSSGTVLANTQSQFSYEGETNELRIRIGLSYLFGPTVTPSSSNVEIYMAPLAVGYVGLGRSFSLSGADFIATAALSSTSNSIYRASSVFSRRGGMTFGYFMSSVLTEIVNPNLTAMAKTNLVDIAMSIGEGVDAWGGLFWSSKKGQQYPSTESNRGATFTTSTMTPFGYCIDVDNSKLQTRPPLPGMI